MDAISAATMKELAQYLDERSMLSDDEYWRLLIKKLPRRMYSNDKIEEFASELQSPGGSPSLLLLYDLKEREIPLQQFICFLEEIGCKKAQNVFTATKMPVFKKHPEGTRVREGSTVVFDCLAECVPGPPQYQWFHNETPLPHSTDCRLILNTIHSGHAGWYTCRACNPRINDKDKRYTFSKSAQLEVIKFPVQESNSISNASVATPQVDSSPRIKSRAAIAQGDIEITKQPQNVDCKYNEEFTLECRAQSISGKPLTYKWIRTKPGRKSEIGTGPVLKSYWSRDDTLHIVCQVSTSNDMVESVAAEVTVTSIWFTEQPINTRARMGDTVILQCKAEGKQPIQYIWLKSGKQDLKSKTPITSYLDTGVLSFDKLTINDSGYYTCQAETNGVFISSNTVSIQFLSSNGTKDNDITIVKQPQSFVVCTGESVNLSCTADSQYQLEYQWYFNDSPMTGHNTQHLCIENVTRSTFGSYKCRVTSSTSHQVFTKSVRVVEGVNPEPRKYDITNTQLDQLSAERKFMTASGEYYAREKVALLIGNQDYESVDISNLTSPKNDIALLKDTLCHLDFKVFTFANLNSIEMNNALDKFCELLVDAGVYAVFYYSGHGFTHHGVEYLMPVDADKPLKCDHCISSGRIATQLQRTKSKVYLFLDSCRVSYSETKVVAPTPKKDLEPCGFANIYRVLSCSQNQPAFEKATEECSVFNIALRKALEDKIGTLHDVIGDFMKEHGQSKGGKEYQRPEFSPSLQPTQIRPHDVILWDNSMSSDDMGRVLSTWESVHAVPPAVDLSSTKAGEWVTGFIKFEMELSNVMLVKAEFSPTVGSSKPSLSLQKDSLRDKIVVVKVMDEEDTGSRNSVVHKKIYRLSDLQQHEGGKLELDFRITVVPRSHPGEEKPFSFQIIHNINNYFNCQ